MGERVTVLGVGIDSITMADAVAKIEQYLQEGRPRLIATANAEMVMLAQQDTELAAILSAADLVVPDGAGVVWAARFNGRPVPERVAGFDLTQHLLAWAADKGYRFFFFGGAPGVAEAAARRAQQLYPGVVIAGVRNGYFKSDEQDEIIGQIRAAKADIILAALGVPKQEKWLYEHMAKLGTTINIGVGGTFDVMAGVARRAPLWMQKAGLEWLYRLLRQPQRLGRMMALPKFVWKVAVSKTIRQS